MRPSRVIPVLVALVGLLTATLQSPQKSSVRKISFGGTGAFEVTETGQYSIKIRYAIPELALQQATSRPGDYFTASLPGHHSLNDPGRPELPVITQLLTMPAYSHYKIEYTNVKSKVIRPNFRGVEGRLYPSQPARPKSQDREPERLVIDDETYKARKFSRTDTVLVEYVGNFRGDELVSVTMIPGRYNPGRNILEVITSAEITITFTPPGGKGTQGYPGYTAGDESKGIKSFSPEHLINGYSDKPAGLVILTDTAFRKQIEPLVKWKTRKGFSVTTIYKGETLAGTTYALLKDSLRKVYEASAPGYLLIVGDLTYIPRSDGTSQLSDMYWGEFTGNGDYIPEMYIGRVPARDTAEVRAFVTKLLQYELQEFSDTNKFYLNALVTAGNDGGYANFMNGHVNYATTYYLNSANGLTTTSFLHPQAATMDDSVKLLMNRGLAFMNYSGHGNVNRWDDPTFTNLDAASLTNAGMYPFVMSNACLTGQFSAENNLARALVMAGNKGAIGFIGCTNDSYWTEDFHYAVGVGMVVLQPEYSPDNLGFYDRLFHTNGETPSQWYYTMGQVNVAGLLAVSASTTSRKKYYWETYSLIGDPTVIPVIGPQSTIEIQIPDTLPVGLRNLSVDAPPFTYMAISDFDTLWDASFVSPTGFISLDLPEETGDSCLIVITGQGFKPFLKTLYFGEPSSTWLNAGSFNIDDAGGNNNGKADYGETVFIGLTIDNLGNQTALNSYAEITSASEWVTILTDSVFTGSIPAKGSVNLPKAFSLRMGSEVPDRGIISFDIGVSDGDTTRLYRHDLIVLAPSMKITSLRFDDSETGNNNRLPDRGESLFLVFTVMNIGTSNTEGVFKITNHTSGFSALTTEVPTGVIPFGGNAEIRVPVTVSSSSFPGLKVSLETTIDCGFYSDTKAFEISIGKTRESFEYGDFDLFPWINSAIPWVITSSYSYDGMMSAMSGLVPNNGASDLQMNMFLPEADTLRFWYKVSSEANYDFFRFSVNGTENFRESGEKDWREKIIPLSAGAHLLEWKYTKDASVAAGLDRAWIDMIDFPESAFAMRDIEVSEIISPAGPGDAAADTIEVKVRNLGGGTINGFNLAYTVNNRFPPVTQYFGNPIPYRDSVTVRFDKPVDLSKYGVYDITVYSFGNDDDFTANDTIKARIENTRIREEAKAFPNPVTENVTLFIRSAAVEKVEIRVSSSSGKTYLIAERSIVEGDNSIELNLGNLPAGTYVIAVRGTISERKFVIIKI
ncbi:MAG: T9SS type A sorting domain-containing protein [Bacteroidetes bacterium]|nr:T9SS type A sorting domain-containing protein [Bacteroidota bacterium]